LKVSSIAELGVAAAEQELAKRIAPAGAALRAQQGLLTNTGTFEHNLGLAAHRAQQAGLITKTEASTLRGLRRKANAAKHEWASLGTGAGDTSAIAGLQGIGSPLPAPAGAHSLGGEAADTHSYVEARPSDQNSLVLPSGPPRPGPGGQAKTSRSPHVDGTLLTESSGSHNCCAGSGACSGEDDEVGTDRSALGPEGTASLRKLCRDRILDLYSVHNPSKLQEVPDMIAQFKDQEHTLYLKVCSKYKIQPEPMLMSVPGLMNGRAVATAVMPPPSP
jgi:hypothetical protein